MNKNIPLKISIAVTTVIFGLSTFAGGPSAPVIDSSYDSDRIIVKYKTKNTKHNARGKSMSEVKRMYNNARVFKLHNKMLKSEIDQLLAEYSASADVEYAELDAKMYPLFTPNDTYYQQYQWHYHEALGGINAPAAWDITKGAGAVVAVLDTGYRPHVDLNANIIGGYDMISDATVGNDGDGRDDSALDPGDWTTRNECYRRSPASDSSWHGTHVAGTVAGVGDNNLGMLGVAFQAQVVPIRVLGTCGGYTSDIADGMVWASGGSVGGTPANSNPAKVLNLSLGGSGACSSTSQNAINTARANGSVVVVAAGNSNANVSGHNPGNCNGVISVAATGRQGEKASYSNYGSLIDIAAPGGNGSDPVWSTLNDGATSPGADNYAGYQGTSMAAPHVAGVAALMFSVNENLTPDQVEQAIVDTARSFPSGSTCSTSNCGAGIIDAAAAVAAAGGGTPPTGNNPPNATFSYSCTDLACTFDGTASSDIDGSIASYSWSFGGSEATASNTFTNEGMYSVSLTVTDNEGATNTDEQSVTVTNGSGPPASELVLSGTRTNRNRTVNLIWNGSTGNVDVYRNNSYYITTANDGMQSYNVSKKKSYTFKVCYAGTTSCSNEIPL